MLFFPDLHVGYLSANARPAVPELWLSGVPGRSEIDARVFRERLSDVGLVLVRSCLGGKDWFTCHPTFDKPNDALDAAVRESFDLSFVHADYAVWKRKP